MGGNSRFANRKRLTIADCRLTISEGKKKQWSIAVVSRSDQSQWSVAVVSRSDQSQ